MVMFRSITGLLLVSSAQAACKAGGYDLGEQAAESSGSPYLWDDAMGNFEYQVTFCGTASCGDDTASICQRSLNYPPITALGSWDDSASWSKTDDGITTQFSNGALCNGAPRITTINLHCADANQLYKVDEPSACMYTVDMDIVCGGGGLSGGWIFIIALIVGGMLYLGLGCLYSRKKMGTSGMKESIPNVGFWSDLPSLVKEGCLFTKGKLTKGRGTSDAYDEI